MLQSKATLQKKARRIITFSSLTFSICKYLGLPSPPPMFVLLSMRSDCYDDWKHMCAWAAMVCVGGYIRTVSYSITEHSSPLFKDWNVIKLSDIITLQLAVFHFWYFFQSY